jgi:hypothetical protein
MPVYPILLHSVTLTVLVGGTSNECSQRAISPAAYYVFPLRYTCTEFIINYRPTVQHIKHEKLTASLNKLQMQKYILLSSDVEI